MVMSRIAREFAAEISSTDWCDAPYRLDRAGHRRSLDNPSRRVEKPLDEKEADFVKTNVMWMVAQVLKYSDPNLDVHEFAAACGVPRSITHRNNGSRSDAITYGLRWNDIDQSVVAPPGAPRWRVQVKCDVPNLVVFKRLLDKINGFDPSRGPEVESTGGATRIVTVILRDWDEAAAGQRAVAAVGAVSGEVLDGGPATLVAVHSAD